MEGRNVINIHRLTELVIITCTPGIEGNPTTVEKSHEFSEVLWEERSKIECDGFLYLLSQVLKHIVHHKWIQVCQYFDMNFKFC